MSHIVPQAVDIQPPVARLTCPVCGSVDTSPSVRVEHLGIMRADCICPNDHLFVVRWNEVV